MRELIKIQRRADRFKAPLPAAAASLLSSRVAPGSVEAQELGGWLGGVTGWASLPQAMAGMVCSVEQRGSDIVFSDGLVSWHLPSARLDNSAVWRGGGQLSIGGAAVSAAVPGTFIRHLVQLALAAACSEPVLLTGPTSCKSLLVRTWCELGGNEEHLLVEHLTSGESLKCVTA